MGRVWSRIFYGLGTLTHISYTRAHTRLATARRRARSSPCGVGPYSEEAPVTKPNTRLEFKAGDHSSFKFRRESNVPPPEVLTNSIDLRFENTEIGKTRFG